METTLIGYVAKNKEILINASDLVSFLLVTPEISKCPSEDFLIPLNHLDSMEPILIRGGAYIVDGQEPGEVRPRSLEISERPD